MGSNAGCGTGTAATTYFRDALNAANGEIVQRSAARQGLGIAGLGSKNMEAFENLKRALHMDSAIAAAGCAMGLTTLGTAAEEPIQEMLSYTRETQHEKIIRGLAVGIAFIFYGRQEQANETIDQLLAEKVIQSFRYDVIQTHRRFRILFCATVVSTRWRWRMQGRPTMSSPQTIAHSCFRHIR